MTGSHCDGEYDDRYYRLFGVEKPGPQFGKPKPRTLMGKIGRDGRDWVYYLRDTRSGYLKIGKTRKLWARLRNLQSANAEPLFLFAVEPNETLAVDDSGNVFDTEAFRHQEWQDYRVRGEWFRPVGDIQQHVEFRCLPVNRAVPDLIRDIEAWRSVRNGINARRRMKTLSNGGVA